FGIEPAHTRVARTDADPTRESTPSVEPPVERPHHHDRKLQTLRLVYRQDAYSSVRHRHRVDPPRLFERLQPTAAAAHGTPSLLLVRARQIEQLFPPRARMRSPAAPRTRRLQIGVVDDLLQEPAPLPLFHGAAPAHQAEEDALQP